MFFAKVKFFVVIVIVLSLFLLGDGAVGVLQGAEVGKPWKLDGAGDFICTGNGKLLATKNFVSDEQQKTTKLAIEIWDLERRRRLDAFTLPHNPRVQWAISSDGKILACTDDKGKDCVLWDVASRKQRLRLPADGDLWLGTILFAPDDRSLLTLHHDAAPLGERKVRLHVWDPLTGKERFPPKDIIDASVRYSRDSKRIVVTGGQFPKFKRPNYRSAEQFAGFTGDPSIILLDAASGKELKRLKTNEHVGGFLAFSPKDRTVAAVGTTLGGLRPWVAKANWISLWDLDTTKVNKKIEIPLGITALSFAPDGKSLIAALLPDNTKPKILWIDTKTGAMNSRDLPETDPMLKGPPTFWKFAIAPGGKHVIVHLGNLKSATLRVYEIPSVKDFKGQAESVPP